jgi:DNA-binding response OmpR family regulator
MNSLPTFSPAHSRVLVVDDVTRNLQVIGTMLRNEGYEVMPATSGAEALEGVRVQAPDLILLDLMMPEMDGLEVCRRLKADATVRQIPVIFLTASNEMEHLIKGFEAGAVDYITKPFQLVELRARIGATIRTKRLQDELTQANRELEAMHLAADQSARAKTEALAKLNQEIQRQMSRVLRTTNAMLPTNLTAEQRGEIETIRASAESLLNLTQRNESRG